MEYSKLLKRSLFGLLILVALLAAGLEVLSRVYHEKAGAFFREKFEKQSDMVLAPFQTRVSVWSHFPRITFHLNNLVLTDTSSGIPETVLRIGQAEIAVPLGQFNLEQLKINRLDLEDILFYQKIDSAGNKIGLRFKKLENPDTTGSGLPFSIPKINLQNARIVTENNFKQSAFSVHIREGKLKANLENGILQLKGNLNGTIDSVKTKQITLFKNEPFFSDLHYTYQVKNKTGDLTKTRLNVNNHEMQVSGTHAALPLQHGQPTGAMLNLQITGNQPLLYLLAQLVPPQANGFLEQVKTESKMKFSLQITGASGPTIRSRNLLKFAIQNGDVYLPATKTTINNVNLAGELDNGDRQLPETSRLTISDFSANTREDSFKIALEISNFLKPQFKFLGEGRMKLSNLASFVNLPVTRIDAGVIVGKVNLSGSLPDSQNTISPDWKGQGSVVLQKAIFRLTGLNVDCKDVNGGIRFRENLLELDGLNGKLAGQPFRLQASVTGYLLYLFDQPGPVKAQATIYAANLNYGWLNLNTQANSRKAKTTAKTKPVKYAEPSFRQASLSGIESEVNLQVDHFQFPEKNAIKNLVVKVNQKDRKISLTRMRFNTWDGGTATANGGFQLHADGLHDPFLNVQLFYPVLDLQDLLKTITDFKKPQKTVSKPVKKSTPPGKPEFLENENYRLNLLVKADKIKYVHVNGSNLRLNASVNSRQLKIEKLDFATAGGLVQMRGLMHLDAPDQKYPVKLRTELHRLNLPEVFEMAEKMKLDVLSRNNIKGFLDCNLTFITELDQTFVPQLERTTAYARATFRKLELIEVAPIQNALRLLKKEKTRHLYFEDLTTNFILSNNRFLTPGLRMNSNLAAFNLSGSYTMGGGADLNMDVGVLNMLVGNNKRRIEKIKAGDSTLAPNFENKQHLVITREQDKYKVKLSNRKQREEKAFAIKQEFRQLIQRYQIDTVFTMGK